MSTVGLRGQFGVLGAEAIGRLFPHATGLQLASAFAPHILGPSTDEVTSPVTLNIRANTAISFFVVDLDQTGLIGDFGLLGNAVMERLFLRSTGLHPTRSWAQSYLGPAASETEPGFLTLDWVQHAYPFAWTVTAPPEMLSLDWVRSAGPFATNSGDAQPVLGTVRLQIIADFPPLGLDEQVAIASANLSILADTSIGELGRVLGTASLSIVANLQSVKGIVQVDASSAMNIIANTSMDGRVTVRSAAALLIKADLTRITGTKRTVRACEFPGVVFNLSSNLPYGIWQIDPDAMFTWNDVITCSPVQGVMAVVDGYLWRLSEIKYDSAWYDWNETPFTNEEQDLSQKPPYGPGAYWMQVAAVNSVGIGPLSYYLVEYNHPPPTPGTGLEIDGIDCMSQIPVVAYLPPTPHVLSWDGVIDVDGDSVVYQVQVWTNDDFVVDPYTGNGEAFFADNIATPSCNLTTILQPGVYFWRVRANDGRQFSDWSPTGYFQVNHPPDKPTELGVEQVV